jgi:hypothetical protein
MADDRLGDIVWVELPQGEEGETKWFRGRLRQWIIDSADLSKGVVELIKEGTAHDVDIDHMNFNDKNPN